MVAAIDRGYLTPSQLYRHPRETITMRDYADNIQPLIVDYAYEPYDRAVTEEMKKHMEQLEKQLYKSIMDGYDNCLKNIVKPSNEKAVKRMKQEDEVS